MSLQTDGNGRPDEVQLDAEMEKVFAVPGNRSEIRLDRFDMAELLSNVDAKDYENKRINNKNDNSGE